MDDGPEDEATSDTRVNPVRYSAVDLGALIQAIGYDDAEAPDLLAPEDTTTEASDIL